MNDIIKWYIASFLIATMMLTKEVAICNLIEACTRNPESGPSGGFRRWQATLLKIASVVAATILAVFALVGLIYLAQGGT